MQKKTLTVVVIVLVIAALGVGAYIWSDRQSNNPSTKEKNCTTYGDRIESQCAEDYVGLSQEDATSKAKSAGLVPKVNKIDGEEQLNTLEGSTPIYFEIENGVVTRAYFEHNVPASS